MLINIFLLVISIIQIVVSFSPICPIKNNDTIIIITEFNNFTEINFASCPIATLSAIELKPNKKIIFDNSFDVNGLTINPIGEHFNIILNNLKGIECRFEPFKNISFTTNYDFSNTFIQLKMSNFDFYVDNILINKDMCKRSLFYKQTGNFIRFWDASFVSRTHYLFLDRTTIFSKPICPLVFKNAQLTIFDIGKLSSSFVEINSLTFIDISNANNSFEINSNIFQLSIKVYHLKIDSKLLNKEVFKELKALDINGQIVSIENDLFKTFDSFKIFRLRTQNSKRVLIYNNKWIDYLNYKIKS